MPTPDPWTNPDNRIESWTDSEGHYHEKIVQGPDEGAHRGTDPNRGRSFEAGADYERRRDQEECEQREREEQEEQDRRDRERRDRE